MKYILSVYCVWIALNMSAQSGFNRSYDLGGHAAAFCSMELAEDTVVIYGTIYQTGASAFGLLFARMDTFGNIIDYKIYNDSLEDDFTLVSPNSFIRLSNASGYAAVGQFFDRDKGYFAKFDNVGNLEIMQEYADTIYSNNIFNQIIESNGNFYIGGTDYDWEVNSTNVVILKINSSGQLIWEKKVQDPSVVNLFGSIIIKDENEFVISGGTTNKPGVVPLEYTKNTSKIFAIDSLGNLKWEWQTQPSLDELGAGPIFHTNDNKWVYHSARGWYNATYNEISIQPKMVVRDEQFNLIKQDTFGVANSPVTVFLNTIPLHNGGWLAVGTNPQNYATPPLSTEFNALSGWMYKIDSNVNKVWSRVDTAFWSTQTGSANYLYDAIELPSGSIIACGNSRTYEPVPKDWGWLIKVSADGCVDTLSCAVLPTQSPSLSPWENLRLYPNPAVSELQITGVPIGLWERIEVLNISGQSLIQLYHTHDDRLDLRGLENGVYIVRLTRAGNTVARKVVKKGR